MKLQTEAKTDYLYLTIYSEVQKIEAELLKLMAYYTFHVDFESPVFADLSISCNNPGENFNTEKIKSKYMIRNQLVVVKFYVIYY